MIANGKFQTSIWLNKSGVIQIIDQRKLPFEFVVENLTNSEDVCTAIKEMKVRGAPLIGVVAAFGIYLACIEATHASSPDIYIKKVADKIRQTRPTAVNLFWAINQQLDIINQNKSITDKINAALQNANKILNKDIECCKTIGSYGFELIEKLSKKKKGNSVNLLTHCNAGWLACVEYGTATSPIYQAFDSGIKVHVWIDETRPRNQGGKLTAWELGQHGIPHTVITDNAGGLLMQKGMVDMVLVGSDRTASNGDVANKIGTYLKALAAKDNKIPFYVALPTSSIDRNIKSGDEILIETRSSDEINYMEGWDGKKNSSVRVIPENSQSLNYGFDITPANLVTGLITEKGICKASEEDISGLFIKKH